MNWMRVLEEGESFSALSLEESLRRKGGVLDVDRCTMDRTVTDEDSVSD